MLSLFPAAHSNECAIMRWSGTPRRMRSGYATKICPLLADLPTLQRELCQSPKGSAVLLSILRREATAPRSKPPHPRVAHMRLREGIHSDRSASTVLLSTLRAEAGQPSVRANMRAVQQEFLGQG